MSDSPTMSRLIQPGREPIADQAWADLEAALRRWANALEARWKDPQFRVFGSGLNERKLAVKTTAKEGAAVTPSVGNPIRGAKGVEVKVERPMEWETAPRLYDAMAEFRLKSLGGPGPTPTEQAVEDARDSVGAVATRYPELRRAVMRVAWGPFGAEGSDEREGGNFSDRGSVQIAIGHLFERVLLRASISVGRLSYAVITNEHVSETVARLRESVEASAHQCEVIALINCPAIDTDKPVRVWEGEWHESPCYLELGYPDDRLCASVLQDLGYEFIHRDSNLDHINCHVRFVYSIPADFTSSERLNVNWTAEAYLRDAVDIVRIVFDGDVGILHLTGRSTSQDELLLNPPFLNIFQEHPRTVPRTPIRRVYDPPPTAPLDVKAFPLIGTLFNRYAVERIRVPGLPVAMDRLRGIFERYTPDEMGRLVDAVTGLEALFLSEGATDELRYRLQIRVARLLEAHANGRIRLAKDFSKAYNLRSKIVHTGSLGSIKEKDADALQRQTIALLRRALQYFILSDFARDKTPAEMGDVWLALMLSDGGDASTTSDTTGAEQTPRIEES